MVRRKTSEEVLRVIPTRISVKNFGPVKEADIELRPLTVLMGLTTLEKPTQQFYY